MDDPGLMPSRWRGQAGRLEVWYTTLTDPATGTGLWLHHELVAPSNGGDAHGLGFAAVFPEDGPVLGRFGPHPWATPGDSPRSLPNNGPDQAHSIRPDGPPGGGPDAETMFACGPGGDVSAGHATLAEARLTGTAGEITWDLTARGGGRPLFTFPRWAWERELLPAAQIVPAPEARFDGTVRYGDRTLELAGALGATARIYGHGNAERWAWLHADLGGGEVCEVVAAVSTRPLLNRLPPLVFVRLRTNDPERRPAEHAADWPADPLRAALRSRARLGLPEWKVAARAGDRRIRITVTQPAEHTVAVDYADPDGRPAVCRNSGRASAAIALDARRGRRWEPLRTWELGGTAHAEVGSRD